MHKSQIPNPHTHAPSIPSSIPIQITPSAPIHTTKTTPQTQIPVVDLDSNEEQGLQSDILNLLGNPQLAKSSAEQPRAEQTSAAKPPTAEPSQAKKTTTAEPAAVDSTRAEQSASHRAEQTVNAEPPQVTEQTAATQTNPPPPSEDKGYGHGVTLDSMIVTPCVPTLVEESINVRTEDEAETLEETVEEFAATSSTIKKTTFMKQAGMTLIYVANTIEKEAESQERMKN